VRLADFIEQRMPLILEEWEAFARSLLPASNGLDAASLRDHAEQILVAVAQDLRTTQNASMQDAKAKGKLMVAGRKLPQTAAEVHAVLRATGGFSIEQLLSEYRALRASVLRLYAQEHAAAKDTLEDIGRFNEAIDQAIAESVKFFHAEVERCRAVFLGVLGHDLRGPLNSILLTARLLAARGHDKPIGDATSRLIRSGERMRELLDDLLDFNRTSLELGLQVNKRSAVLEDICREEVDLRRASHPDIELVFASSGPTSGQWDASRMRQLIGNLVTNAASYGSPGSSIEVLLEGHADEVRLHVRNEGARVSRDVLMSMFEPLHRIASGGEHEVRSNLGLGLFIVREVARAHGGNVDVHVDEGKTDFIVTLPIVPQTSC
jgi:signal transduction histidine kinase